MFFATIFYLLTKSCIVDTHRHLIALFKYFKHVKSSEDYLIRPSSTDSDCRPCFSEIVPPMVTKQPGCQTRSRLTGKLAKVRKNVCAQYYMVTPEDLRKANRYAVENGMTNVILRESSGKLIQW